MKLSFEQHIHIQGIRQIRYIFWLRALAVSSQDTRGNRENPVILEMLAACIDESWFNISGKINTKTGHISGDICLTNG